MISEKTQRKVENFGLNLYKIRTAKHITKEDLAYGIGLESPRMIYNYENGIKAPTLERLIQIADFLDVSIDSLVN